jgi:hypothetical protein
MRKWVSRIGERWTKRRPKATSGGAPRETLPCRTGNLCPRPSYESGRSSPPNRPFRMLAPLLVALLQLPAAPPLPRGIPRRPPTARPASAGAASPSTTLATRLRRITARRRTRTRRRATSSRSRVRRATRRTHRSNRTTQPPTSGSRRASRSHDSVATGSPSAPSRRLACGGAVESALTSTSPARAAWFRSPDGLAARMSVATSLPSRIIRAPRRCCSVSMRRGRTVTPTRRSSIRWRTAPKRIIATRRATR